MKKVVVKGLQYSGGLCTGSKITGDMKYRFGKDGCESDKEEFKATR